MIRFFAAPSEVSGGAIRLSAEDAAHIRSLRLRPADFFVVCDGVGNDYVCRLGARSGKADESDGGAGAPGGNPVAEIVEKRPSRGETNVACDVYIAFAKGDRLDYAVQKSVELGARGVTLFPSARCVSAPENMHKKTARFQRIALETAKQCGRGRIPQITAADSFAEAVRQASRADLPLFFYECEAEFHLKHALEQYCPVSTISVVTGPEGGFEPDEAVFAQSTGMVPVTLGPRILRCETAPVAALAAVMYHTDNL